MREIVRHLAGATLQCVALLTWIHTGTAQTETPDLAERVLESVVRIETDTGAGSGFVVGDNGLIITNSHVLRNVDAARVQLANGETFDQMVILADDAGMDLALLRVPSTSLRALCIGDDTHIQRGESVLVFGAPLGLSGTVTQGIISARRVIDGTQVLQLDAAAAPGSSGGPVVADNGCVVGVLTAGIPSEDFNFAVASRYIGPLRDPLFHLREPRLITGERLRASDTRTASNRGFPRSKYGSVQSILEGIPDVCIRATGRRALGSVRYVREVLDRAGRFTVVRECSRSTEIVLLLVDGDESSETMFIPYLETVLPLNVTYGSFVLAAVAHDGTEPFWSEAMRITWMARGAALDLTKAFVNWTNNWYPRK